MILMRTLRKDYARYSKEEEMDDWQNNQRKLFEIFKIFTKICGRVAELRKYTENIEIIKKMIRAKTDGDGTKQNEFQ